jgi:hypothetical protein
VIREYVSHSISDSKEEIELHKLAQFFARKRRNHRYHGFVEMVYDLGTETTWDLAYHLEEYHPRMSQMVKLGKRLGISWEEIRLLRYKLEELDSSTLEDRLDVIDERVSDFLESNPVETRIPAELIADFGCDYQQARKFSLLTYNVQELVGRQALWSLQSTMFPYSLTMVGSRDFEAARECLVEVLEYLSVFSAEYAARNSLLIERINSVVSDLAAARAEDAIILASISAIPELSAIQAELSALGEPMREARDDLFAEFHASIPPESMGRLFLFPRIDELIRTVCLVPPQRGGLRFVELVRAIAEISSKLVAKEKVSLSKLSSYIYSFSLPLAKHIQQEAGSDWLVVKTAFEVSHLFSVNLLRDYPYLLPDWSDEKIYCTRKIIGSFLWFDGPTDWTERAEALSVAIARSSDERLQQALPVLFEMHKRGFNILDEAALVTPGSWLVEFLREAGPSPYAVMVTESLRRSPFPKGKWTHLTRLPNQIEEVVSEYFKFPDRFLEMSLKANRLTRDFSLDMPHPSLLYAAVRLPRQLLHLETRLGVVHEGLILIERAVESYLDLVQALGEKTPQALREAEVVDAHTCRLSVDHIVNYLFQDDPSINPILQEELNLFILESSLLTRAIRANEVVAFVVGPDERHFCEFRFTPPLYRSL